MIQVINRALDILEFLSEDPERHKPLSEISEKLNLNNGTCANIIKTLVARNYIEKLEKKKGYCLGAKSYGLTGNEDYKKDLTEAAKKELDLLTNKLNENCLLAVLDNDIRRVIVRVLSSHSIQASTAAEKRAYDSSSGRSLIAMLSDVELEKFIKRFGVPVANEWEDAKDKKALLNQITKIRADGYASQLNSGNIVGLAVPIYKGLKVIASISVYMPQFRYTKLDKMELIDHLKESSKNISDRLK
jgi:DNA-binding IclR family transcriptional regulator